MDERSIFVAVDRTTYTKKRIFMPTWREAPVCPQWAIGPSPFVVVVVVVVVVADDAEVTTASCKDHV